MWIIAGDELDAELLEVGHDDGAAHQSVDLGDDEPRLAEGGVASGGAELGAAVDVVVHAALDFHVGADQLAADHGAVGLDGGVLGLEAEAALALLVGGDPHQADQLGRHCLSPLR